MLYSEKNDGGIEVHLNYVEREIIHSALRHYSAYGKQENYIIDNMPTICELLNVLELPEFKSKIKESGDGSEY